MCVDTEQCPKRAATRILFVCASLAFLAAIIAYMFHDLRVNPQYDNQGIWNAIDVLNAFRQGTLFEYLMVTRKYPFFYVLNYAVIYRVISMFWDTLPQTGFFFIGRLLTVAYTLGIFVVLRRIGKQTTISAYGASILLMSSVLFLMFSSAIRPHMIVGFWTLLAYCCSIGLRERRTASAIMFAFGSATLAFCTLQSGLLAFLFPVWGMLGTRPRWGNVPIVTVISVAFLLLAVPLGYTFLAAPLFGYEMNAGADLGHGIGVAYSFEAGMRVVLQLLGDSPLLLVFAALGLLPLMRDRKSLAPELVPVIVYLALYFAIFLFHITSMGRYFIPVLPFLAILGSKTFGMTKPIMQHVLMTFIIVTCARFAYLATVPNTFQQAGAFIATRPGLVRGEKYPYFLPIPKERLVDSPTADILVIPHEDRGKFPEGNGWVLCADFIASNGSDELNLLWIDTEWALYRLFEASAFGPNLAVFCENDEA